MNNANNLNYLKDFSVRNLDMLAMSKNGAEVFNILSVPVSPFFAIVFTTGVFLSPPTLHSGRRTMTHFTEAALLGARPGETPRFLVGAKTFCSSADEFDLVKGEKVALARLLEQIKRNNPGFTNRAQRATAWKKYFAARDEQDDQCFKEIMAQAKVQEAAAKAKADAQRWMREMAAKQEFFSAPIFPPRTRPQLEQNLQVIDCTCSRDERLSCSNCPPRW